MNEKRELTCTSIILGCLLAVVFGAANAYLGLRVGLTVSASIPAAVVSMGVMRFLLRRDSMLENNMAQTIGSAGESLASGAIFTMPALYLWADEGLCAPPGFLSLTVIALAGGVLGTLFMIPLRKPLIVDEDKTLVYPEGRACAEVIKAGTKGAQHSSTVFAGLGLAVVIKLVTDLFKWVPSAVSLPVRFLRGEMGLEFSPALGAVGFIVGPKIASLLFSGSFLGWMVLIPIFCCCSETAATAYANGGASAVWKEYIRFVGAGAIATGGFYSLVKSIPLFVKTFRDSLKGAGGAKDGEDISMKKVVVGIIAVIVILAALPIVPVGIGGALLVALFGFFFAAVSARMVGIVGSSNNPVSHGDRDARRLGAGPEDLRHGRGGRDDRGDLDRVARLHRRGDGGRHGAGSEDRLSARGDAVEAAGRRVHWRDGGGTGDCGRPASPAQGVGFRRQRDSRAAGDAHEGDRRGHHGRNAAVGADGDRRRHRGRADRLPRAGDALCHRTLPADSDERHDLRGRHAPSLHGPSARFVRRRRRPPLRRHDRGRGPVRHSACDPDAGFVKRQG